MRGGGNITVALVLIAGAVVLYLFFLPDAPAKPGPGPEAVPPARPRAAVVLERGLGEPVKAPWVLVRRSARELSLYDGKTLVKRYRVAVGGNTEGDKEREGDRITPLGSFYVCTRNDKSKFHLFLGLSYPAPDDAERGLQERLISRGEHRRILEAHRAKRRPSWKTKLGGEIGLHGGGADRPNGTLGCVGMTNGDIEELWKILRIGDTVVIEP